MNLLKRLERMKKLFSVSEYSKENIVKREVRRVIVNPHQIQSKEIPAEVKSRKTYQKKVFSTKIYTPEEVKYKNDTIKQLPLLRYYLKQTLYKMLKTETDNGRRNKIAQSYSRL